MERSFAVLKMGSGSVHPAQLQWRVAIVGVGEDRARALSPAMACETGGVRARVIAAEMAADCACLLMGGGGDGDDVDNNDDDEGRCGVDGDDLWNAREGVETARRTGDLDPFDVMGRERGAPGVFRCFLTIFPPTTPG